MLSGSYFFTLDRKGRLVVPRELRRELGSALWVTWSPRRHIVLCGELRPDVPQTLEERDCMLSLLYRVELKRDGRVQLPHVLRRMLGAEPGQEVAIVGVGSCVLVMTIREWHMWNAVRRTPGPGLVPAWCG